MNREAYDDNAYWRARYLDLLYEFGDTISHQQDLILRLSASNKRFKKEKWQLRKQKRRKKANFKKHPLKSPVRHFRSKQYKSS